MLSMFFQRVQSAWNVPSQKVLTFDVPMFLKFQQIQIANKKQIKKVLCTHHLALTLSSCPHASSSTLVVHAREVCTFSTPTTLIFPRYDPQRIIARQLLDA
ncbi:hypothetical protein I311_06983 [Cryptococcus gattii NT-10]|nr:hypothetical protein I311_06983 [Cryptococcus gattii NT-10]